MIFSYDKYIEENFGPITLNYGMKYSGGYITPSGNLFNLNRYTSVEHASGIILPFFVKWLFLKEENYSYLKYRKSKLLQDLIESEKYIVSINRASYDDDLIMHLSLLRYFINCYNSDLAIIRKSEDGKYFVDFSTVIGHSINNQGKRGELLMKEILVQACNYDAVESQLSKTITTSKFNVFETYYDYLLMDFKVYQIPKKVYSDDKQCYVDLNQSDFHISHDEELLREEVEAIKKMVPLERRYKYFRGENRDNPLYNG